MPNRLIKESFRLSDKVNALTDFQFRLWVCLITYVDDFGRGDARPAVIKGACFPLREKTKERDIAAGLNGLASAGCIVLYESDGRPYLFFPNWDKHQTVRNKHSKFPAPDLQTLESNCKQMNANVPVIQSNPNPNPNPNIKASADACRSLLEIAMDDFTAARKAMKKPLTQKARELTLRELEKLAPGDEAMQVAILNQSIQRGWQGVFPLKEDKAPAKGLPREVKPLSGGDDLDRLERLMREEAANG